VFWLSVRVNTYANEPHPHALQQLLDERLTLRGSDYAHAVQELNKAIDQANDLLHL
jgi:hypothetical protein